MMAPALCVQMDAAGALILLSILILLAKDPVADTPVGHPLFLAMAAVLALPLLTLGPAPLRTWWVLRAPLLVAVQCCWCVCDVPLVMAKANDCMHVRWQ
jgi:hypothetical protein